MPETTEELEQKPEVRKELARAGGEKNQAKKSKREERTNSGLLPTVFYWSLAPFLLPHRIETDPAFTSRSGFFAAHPAWHRVHYHYSCDREGGKGFSSALLSPNEILARDHHRIRCDSSLCRCDQWTVVASSTETDTDARPSYASGTRRFAESEGDTGNYSRVAELR